MKVNFRIRNERLLRVGGWIHVEHLGYAPILGIKYRATGRQKKDFKKFGNHVDINGNRNYLGSKVDSLLLPDMLDENSEIPRLNRDRYNISLLIPGFSCEEAAIRSQHIHISEKKFATIKIVEFAEVKKDPIASIKFGLFKQ